MRKAVFALCIVAMFVSLAGADGEYKRWKLDFTWSDPAYVVVKNSLGEVRLAWYMTYTVENKTEQDVPLHIKMTVTTDTKKSYRGSIDPEARVASVRCWGSLDVEAAMRGPRELTGDPGFDDDLGVLVDGRETDYAPGADDLLGIARDLANLDRLRGHRVGVVLSDPYQSLAAEIAAAICGDTGLEIQVFSSLSEARVWALDGRRIYTQLEEE